MKRYLAPSVEVLVCQAGACRNAGSEAVLLEIEELAKDLGRCKVQASGCLGNCGQAPNAIVVDQGRETMYPRLDDVEKSAALVQKATGQAPNLDDPSLRQRLQDARRMRMRKQAKEENKWNVAMAGLTEQVAHASGNKRLQLQFELSQLLTSAGRWEEALDRVSEVMAAVPSNISVIMERAKVLGKLRRLEEIDALQEEVSEMFSDPDDFRAELEVTSALKKCKTDDSTIDGEKRIENYGLWKLDSITEVSQHSAIYHFVSKDRQRGTPNRRGRGRTVWSKTWHTTLLASVGANEEGPLPWIERDYTPISSWKDWEQGKCDILIKIYSTGQATSWLYKQPLGCNVWLSQPAKTLDVPCLAPDVTQNTLKHNSVLLVLAGSGIVVAAQVVHHADRSTCFGSFPVLTSPISLVYSCRKDDVVMVSDLMSWCKTGRLVRCTVTVTESQGTDPPFPNAADSDLNEFGSLANASCIYSRVSRELLEKELSTLKSPCRIVVSGPGPFNSAVRGMLSEIGVASEAISILAA